MINLNDIFKAYDIRGIYPDMLDAEVAWRIGYGVGQFLGPGEGSPRVILVSRDMRPHSPELSLALTDGIRASGQNVVDLGQCDTSFIYFAINHLQAAGGVQTTASHNPVQYNGFKISGGEARPVGRDSGLMQIQQIAQELPGDVGSQNREPRGTYEQCDLWPAYRQHVLGFLRPLTRPIKVFIDASNGMAGRLVPKVFEGVENLHIVDLNFEITGAFSHDPNPLVPENMVPTQQGVRDHGADLGACFDGDADRCILTDEKGQIVGCDHLTALLCGHFMDLAPGAAVVYDLRSSKVVEERIRDHGGVPHRNRVGHVFMKAMMRETKGIFGGELSGHFYFRDNFYTDSGAIAFASVLSVLGNTATPLSEMIEPLRTYPQSGERNFRVQDKAAVLALLQDLYNDAEIDHLDGVTIDYFATKGWWINVRPSNTEPLLRLNAEARNASILNNVLEEIEPLLGEPALAH